MPTSVLWKIWEDSFCRHQATNHSNAGFYYRCLNFEDMQLTNALTMVVNSPMSNHISSVQPLVQFCPLSIFNNVCNIINTMCTLLQKSYTHTKKSKPQAKLHLQTEAIKILTKFRETQRHTALYLRDLQLYFDIAKH